MPNIYAGAPVSANADFPTSVTVTNNDSQVNLTNTTYSAGSPVVSLTFVAPTSGQVLVTVGAGMRDNSTGSARVHVAPLIRLGGPTGTIVLSPDVATRGVGSQGETKDYQYCGRTTLVEGLTPGETYYAEVQHKVSASGGADLTERDMTIVPVPLGGGRAGSEVLALDMPPAVQAIDTTQINNPSGSSYVPGSPVVAVTFTAPTSGRVLLIVGGGVGNGAGNRIFLAPQVFLGTGPSGTEVLSPTVAGRGYSSGNAAGGFHYGSRETILDGLQPGATYYARVTQAVPADGLSNVQDIACRQITVVPIP